MNFAEFLQDNITTIYSGFIVVILALVFYIAYLFKKIYKIRRDEKQVWDWLDHENQSRHQRRAESLRVICQATQQEQCELSEACIRVKKLLEFYPQIENKDSYLPIKEMYEEIKDFDTHEDRNTLSKQEKFRQDKQRFEIERRYEKEFLQALKILEQDIDELRNTSYQDSYEAPTSR